MLTAELAQSIHRGGQIRPCLIDWENTEVIRTATELIEIVRQHLGARRATLDTALAAYVGVGTDYKTLRGLMKILVDGCEFETVSATDPLEIRRHLFRAARHLHPLSLEMRSGVANESSGERGHFIAEAAQKFNCEPEEITQGLYADLSMNQRMTVFDEPTPVELIHRYNLAQAQALLYRAIEMHIRLQPDDALNSRRLFDAIKAYGLIHHISGSAHKGYEVRLSGPVSMFHRSQKYGIQMAVFLPALLLCKGWRMCCEIAAKMNNGTGSIDAFYELDEGQKELNSHYRTAPTGMDNGVDKLLNHWSRLGGKWSLRKTSEVIDLGVMAFVPDLVAEDNEGRSVYIEVFGFWTPTHLRNKIGEFKGSKFQDWLIVASDELRCSRDPMQKVPPNICICKATIDARKVMESLDTIPVR